ncbi:MAG: manganese efflux pump MntP family protein [Cellulosilyticaceae bacterium]
MDFITLFITSIALAGDATAVSIAAGLSCKDKNERLRSMLNAGIAFGVFQGGMTFLGWTIGYTFQDFIVSFDHWIAFILLCFIGFKMIKEATNDEVDSSISLLNPKTVLILAVATSIDALAVGVSFAVLSLTLSEITLASFIIFITTGILSLIGVLIGAKISTSSNLGKRINIAGGIVLILIGTKILIEHLLI